MKCKYCKTELDGAAICKNCGAPAPLDEDYKEEWNEMMGYTPDEEPNYDSEYDSNYDSEDDADDRDLAAYEKKQEEMRQEAKKNRLGTVAIVLAVTGVFAPIGFILALIDITLRKDGTKKIPSKLAIFTSIFVVDMAMLLFFIYRDDWSQDQAEMYEIIESTVEYNNSRATTSEGITYFVPDYKVAMQASQELEEESCQVFHVYITYIDVLTDYELVLAYKDIQKHNDYDKYKVYFYDSKETALEAVEYKAYIGIYEEEDADVDIIWLD